MSRNRYVADYRIVESIDSRGRIRSDYEYIGAPYVYARGMGAAKAARVRVAACCALGWAAWIGALLPLSSAMRRLYVALPFALVAVPLALTTGIAASLFSEREPFEHRHADRLENRAPACTFFAGLLGAVALVGEGVNVLLGAQLLPGDGIFAAGAAALLVCAIVCHRQWKALKCRTADLRDAGSAEPSNYSQQCD